MILEMSRTASHLSYRGLASAWLPRPAVLSSGYSKSGKGVQPSPGRAVSLKPSRCSGRFQGASRVAADISDSNNTAAAAVKTGCVNWRCTVLQIVRKVAARSTRNACLKDKYTVRQQDSMKHRWFILFCCCIIMHVVGNKSMHNVSNITHAASRYAAIDTHTHTHTQAYAFSPCPASVMFGVCEGSAGWAS